MAKKPRIMIIDGNTELSEELKAVLEAGGKKVNVFTDGEDAVDNVEKIKPDIIFIDVKWGRGNSFFTVLRLRDLAHTKNTPIITMSRHYTNESIEKFMSVIGINGHISKPFRPEHVEKLIDDTVSK
ncbi:MAG: PleD family two-component system response regulator [Candidatus Goldiibacteriota bacterium]